MKLTLAAIRREVWRIVRNEIEVIHIVNLRGDCSARCEYTLDGRGIEIWVDPNAVRIDRGVIHEVLHKILDPYFETTFSYHVYEYFIIAIEENIFKYITNKHQQKLVRLINTKLEKG